LFVVLSVFVEHPVLTPDAKMQIKLKHFHSLYFHKMMWFVVVQTIGLEPIFFCASLSPVPRYPIANIKASIELA
jgi:hypothetical protein